MTVLGNVLQLIGNTPVVRARQLDAGACELFLKLECMNPGGSIGDAARASDLTPTHAATPWP